MKCFTYKNKRKIVTHPHMWIKLLTHDNWLQCVCPLRYEDRGVLKSWHSGARVRIVSFLENANAIVV